MTPSGSPPNSLIKTSTSPAPAPKIHAPDLVTGEVTMSVAIKKAPALPERALRGFHRQAEFTGVLCLRWGNREPVRGPVVSPLTLLN